MSMLRDFLIKLALKKGWAVMVIPEERISSHKGRDYVHFSDDLRLIYEDGEYVGFATQEPYVG